ncbi:C2H2-like zinc finger protein [Actinidia rufa]|uniref:C2H2-like zinc finger protein n=1 Tax=Actinidia rufa TaxID=165716 RepID=A0A7J0EHU4_9ERIC|nr:C2H2-like zinc finger protein [Actinidia rufa]
MSAANAAASTSSSARAPPSERYTAPSAAASGKSGLGHGLTSELKRAGVYVETVEDKPQAADLALGKQTQNSLSRGIDWLFLVSDFSWMLRRARESNLGIMVVGEWDRALGRHADLWVPWAGVENGEISVKDLRSRRGDRDGFVKRGDGSFSVSEFDGEGGGERNLDSVVDELVG